MLLDCAERYYGNSKLMENVAGCMKAAGCTEISAIIITHLHHDHYGGIESLQRAHGPGIPVYKSVENEPGKIVRALEKRGQLHFFVRPNGEPRFHAKREGFQTFDQASKAKAEQGGGDGAATQQQQQQQHDEESEEEARWPFELPEGEESNLDWLLVSNFSLRLSLLFTSFVLLSHSSLLFFVSGRRVRFFQGRHRKVPPHLRLRLRVPHFHAAPQRRHLPLGQS